MTRPSLVVLKTDVKINQVPVKKIKLTREELIKKNSVTLNFIALLIFIGICYFLYNVSYERKLLNEYILMEKEFDSNNNVV